MAISTLRHNSAINAHHSPNSVSVGNIASRSSSGEILSAQLQQRGHAIAGTSHEQTTGLWDLANSADMSYDLAAAGTGML